MSLGGHLRASIRDPPPALATPPQLLGPVPGPVIILTFLLSSSDPCAVTTPASVLPFLHPALLHSSCQSLLATRDGLSSQALSLPCLA